MSVVSDFFSGLIGRDMGSQNTTQKQLIDQLLSSLSGQGPYSDLFNTNEEAFQRSFVQPALNRFQNQIAPEIQQQYLATGQQGGSGIQDSLARAGVNLQSDLDSRYMDYLTKGQDRMQNMLANVLSQSSQLRDPESWASALGGFIGSDILPFATGGGIENIMRMFSPRSTQSNTKAKALDELGRDAVHKEIPYREGFVN